MLDLVSQIYTKQVHVCGDMAAGPSPLKRHTVFFRNADFQGPGHWRWTKVQICRYLTPALQL